MVWMEKFCFSCSVRLGVIITAICSLFEILIPFITIISLGRLFFKEYIIDVLEHDDEFSHQGGIEKLLHSYSNDPEQFLLCIIILGSLYMISCILAVFGAIKLLKWFLAPFILMEFTRLCLVLGLHIISMIILKKRLNLGVLIAATILGGFFILFLGYMWGTAVALFQIITIVNTDRYKLLYGDDPLNPLPISTPKSLGSSVENIKMYMTPNFDNLTPLKHDKLQIKKLLKENPISTIPINNFELQATAVAYRNWYINELPGFKKSNLMKFY